MEANVVKRDGLVLVREMAMEVKNMMDFKMNAVMVRQYTYLFRIYLIFSLVTSILYLYIKLYMHMYNTMKAVLELVKSG